MDETEAAVEPWIEVASFGMCCPSCGLDIPVTVLCQLTVEEDGRQYMRLEPDMTEMWSHTFTHDQ